MHRVVVDASVAIKWFIPELHAESAAALLQPDLELHAPDLIWAEIGNVLWKKQRRGEIDEPAGRALLADVRRFPIQVHDSATLADTAWTLACSLDRTFYDSLYLALAMSLHCRLVTADEHLVNALRGKMQDELVVWVGNRQI